MDSTARQSRQGRPAYTAAQQEAIRRRFVTIARELFTDEGFEHVSMRRIAAQAGYSPMALYRYFANKRALLRFIWDDIFAHVFAQCDEALASLRDPLEGLRTFALVYTDYWFAHPDHYRVIFLNEDAIGPEGDRYYVDNSGILERFALVRTQIAAAMRQGRIAKGDAELCAQQFLCALQGVLHGLITIPEYPWRERETLVTSTVDTLLRGFATPA